MSQLHISSPGSATMNQPRLHQEGEALFRFCIRNSNPELWRTTLPLIVYERCAGHNSLIATWIAIHWLIVAHAAAGRRDFGVREIAARARVSRNALTGPAGYIQRLVDLGLIQIVGKEDRNGQFRVPRLVYAIDLWELERLSMALIPDVLRMHGVTPPPRPLPDPRQTSFLSALDELDEPAIVPAALAQYEDALLALHGNGTGSRAQEPAAAPEAPMMHANGPVLLAQNGAPAPAMHSNGPVGEVTGEVLHSDGPVLHSNGPVGEATGEVLHSNGPVLHSNGPALAHFRDVEREREGEKERGSEIARTREIFEEIAAQTAQVVIQTLQQQGLIGIAPLTPSETTPPDQPALPNTLIALWEGDRGTISQRDRHQVLMLASELDGPTGGYGAYWVGRAILIADRCLAERGQSLSINYLRGMLRRWQREGSWGSDLEAETEDAPTVPSHAPARSQGRAVPDVAGRVDAPASTSPVGAAADSPPDSSALDHPAIVAYTTAFSRTPNAVQAQQIAETVSDLAAWQQVLTEWQAHGWKEASVANMLDRYRKDTGGAAPLSEPPPPSVALIHTYPNLTMEQRERWIRKFHAATTPAEKRAVISRLEQEHPHA